MIHDYSSTPVWFDFETQSACDLKEHGGRIYSECPSTRVLTLSCLIDSKLVIWIPKGVAPTYKGEIFLPKQYAGLYSSIELFQTEELPPPITEAIVQGRTFAAFNVSHFDYFIFKNCVLARGLGELPAKFADVLYLARLAGLPQGGLDAAAKKFLGESKDSAKKLIDKLFYAEWENGEIVYPTVLPGLIEPLIRYCSVDTLILARLWESFGDLPVETDAIQAHQNINDRGIQCDLKLAERLITTGIEASRRAAEEVEKLTGGELYGDTINRKGNLRSTQQVHAWLKRQGVSITVEVHSENGKERKNTLRKDIVQTYLDNPLLFLAEDTELIITPTNLKHFNDETLPLVTKVLKARATACRITSAKAERMGKRASGDGRLYDVHTYCKAHTRRASSQGVQIHNLTRGNKKVPIQELLSAHEIGTWPTSASDSYDFIRGKLPDSVSVDDSLSSLIRSCLYARQDHVLGIADYAAIECRGIAWIAGEQKLLDSFAANRDVYCEFASILYGREIIPNESNQPPERQVGKVVVLGCIAEGTQVLTEMRGWIPIESVSTSDKLWDGEAWVSHSGVINKGIKRCIRYKDVWLTPDHKVLTDGGWVRACQLNENIPYPLSGRYMENGQLLVLSTGNGAESLNLFVDVPADRLSNNTLTTCRAGKQPNVTRAESKKGNQKEFYTRQIYSKLTGNDCSIGYPLLFPDVPTQVADNGTVTEDGESGYIQNGSKIGRNLYPISVLSKDGIIRNSKLTVKTITDITNREIYDLPREPNNVETRNVTTYDILNCGPNNRFQAGELIVHNCGYGMGVEKFALTASLLGVDLKKAGTSAEKCVETYRAAYQRIAGSYSGSFMGRAMRRGGIWEQLNTAALKAVIEGGVHVAGKCAFAYDSENRILIVTLPSGGQLRYYNCRVEDRVPSYAISLGIDCKSRPTIVYEGDRGEKSIYGGLIAENLCQAICRDILYVALIRCEQYGIPLIAHVHDETVGEYPEANSRQCLQSQTILMSHPPDWADGFPIAVEGYLSKRYLKSPAKNAYKVTAINGVIAHEQN